MVGTLPKNGSRLGGSPVSRCFGARCEVPCWTVFDPVFPPRICVPSLWPSEAPLNTAEMTVSVDPIEVDTRSPRGVRVATIRDSQGTRVPPFGKRTTLSLASQPTDTFPVPLSTCTAALLQGATIRLHGWPVPKSEGTYNTVPSSVSTTLRPRV